MPQLPWLPGWAPGRPDALELIPACIPQSRCKQSPVIGPSPPVFRTRPLAQVSQLRTCSLVHTASAPAHTTTSYPSHHLTHFPCAGHVVASLRSALCSALLRNAPQRTFAREKHWEDPIHHRTAKPRPPSANRPARPIQKEPALSPSLLTSSASSRLRPFLYFTSPHLQPSSRTAPLLLLLHLLLLFPPPVSSLPPYQGWSVRS